MRTYGKDSNGVWSEITETSYIWLATLTQTLRLIQGESPFYSTYGIPAYQSVQTQIAPDIAVSRTQQQYAPYFAQLLVSKAQGTTTPTYYIYATFLNGTQIQTPVYT
jgi:hypothetical protein